MPATTIWDQVLTLIEGKVGPHSFSTWFKPTSLKADEGRALVIRVPAPLYVEWLPRHYSVVLAEALAEVGRGQVQLVFEVQEQPSLHRLRPPRPVVPRRRRPESGTAQAGIHAAAASPAAMRR